MFDVISSSKNTQWHSFPNLMTKYNYSHISNEPVDFQLITNRNYFLEVNKKSGFELLRTQSKNNVDIIQRVKKRQMDDLRYAAVSKMYGSEIALGLSNGMIRLFNLEQGDFMPLKLKPNKIGDPVVCLDYSNCDEYLAALFDSRVINIYGLKTNIKTDDLQIDSNPKFCRFHPTKRFNLAVASYNGAITLYDIQAKRKIFYDKDAHISPVPEIAMCGNTPDIIVSCSFDRMIKVFDLRKRSAVRESQQSHPLSTIALSPCGTYCVAGNLRGDVISFDFRNLKQELDMKRAHDSMVIRVAFIPSITDENATRFGESMVNATSLVTPLPAPVVRNESLESFNQFIDLCTMKQASTDISPNRGRDSLLELGIANNLHDFSTDSMASPSRVSLGSEFAELRLRRATRPSLSSSLLSDVTPTTPNAKKVEEETPKMVPVIVPPAIKRTRLTESGGGLSGIEEEEDAEAIAENKENQQNNQQDIESFNKFIKTTHVSTPNMLQTKAARAEIDAFNMERFTQIMEETFERKLHAMEERFMGRINELENECKFLHDSYFHTSFRGSFNLFRKIQRELDVTQEAIAVLVRDDAASNEYYRMKHEIEQLKAQLSKRN